MGGGICSAEQSRPEEITRNVPGLKPFRIHSDNSHPLFDDDENLQPCLPLSRPIGRIRWLLFLSKVVSAPLKSQTLPFPLYNDESLHTWPSWNWIYRLAFTDISRDDLTSATPQHTWGRGTFQKFDIRDFFPSITRQAVVNVLNDIGFTHDAAEVLSQLLAYRDRLPLGACTSPLLSNLCLRPLDMALQNLAIEHGLIYTRYSDDMAFSGDEQFDVEDEIDIAV